MEEREEIVVGLARKESVQAIAARLGRAPSTISREVARNRSRSPWRYRAFPAHIKAAGRARRNRPRKLAAGTPVRALVAGLLRGCSAPGQIAGRLKRDHPGQPELQVSAETIYQALFVQGKGSLRAEVNAALRCGRARRRRPRMGAPKRARPIRGMISISERPAEAEDRAVPGRWEGDLERHEAHVNRAVVKGHRGEPVAAGLCKLGAAYPVGTGGYGWQAAPTTTGRASTVRWPGSGKRDGKVYERNQRPYAPQEQTTSSNLTDLGWAAARIRAYGVRRTPWLVNVARPGGHGESLRRSRGEAAGA